MNSSQQEGIRALLVEDNPGDARLIQEMLRDSGACLVELIHANRLEEACQWISKKRFDILLLDLGLPDSNGIDTFFRLREHLTGIPVVILTGLEDEESGIQTVQAGAQDYLVKGQIDGRLLA